MSSRDPFAFRGGLKVIDSATIICLRRRPAASSSGSSSSPPLTYSTSRVPASIRESLLCGRTHVTFRSQWQVLLGQREVVNWMRSTEERLKFMAYPGEWALPGGAREPGEDIASAAARELSEEFLVGLPPVGASASIRPLFVKQTRPVHGRSHLMHNFVAVAEHPGNEWLQEMDVAGVNLRLDERRRKHQGLVESGRFWSLTKDEKEAVSPEVYRLRWMDVGEAVLHALSSMHVVGGGKGGGAAAGFVDGFQETQLRRFGLRRDPMYMTAVSLLELEQWPCGRAIAAHCEAAGGFGGLRAQMQYLVEGMTQHEMQRAPEPAGLIKTIDAIDAIHDEWQAKLRLPSPVAARL